MPQKSAVLQTAELPKAVRYVLENRVCYTTTIQKDKLSFKKVKYSHKNVLFVFLFQLSHEFKG